MKKSIKNSFRLILIPISALILGCALPAICVSGTGSSSTGGKQYTFTDIIYEKTANAFDRIRYRLALNNREEGSYAAEADDYSYIAKGFENRSGEVFRINGGFSADFYGINRKFNRMTYRYSSSEPLKLSVTYRTGLKKTETLYYLEASDNGEFRCLIEPYLNGKKSRGIVKIKIRTCTGEDADFSLLGIDTEKIPDLEDKTCYIENQRFRAGIKLAWGGGINCIEDKTCPVEGLTNLINQHDTGRLIQQSYYGTAGNGEYEPGVSFDVKWVYNPVQGGDQYGNSSRLIDYEINEDSVYIRSQPQDWSLDNALTPSYMENTYTVYGDCIRVDNRFVDFSGWEHRYSEQELPAFYTVSYLSRFTWYDGTDSWTGDNLSYRDDLEFWGDYPEECTFRYKNGNTETWCSWTSPENGFGIGLYVPGVDSLKAGKYRFNNSKDADNEATNYVAPLKVIKMTSFSPVEYSYIMTTGTADQIRETFTGYRDFTENPGLYENSVSGRTGD